MSLFGAIVLGTSASATTQESSEPSIAFNDQTTNGTTVTVNGTVTDVLARFVIRDADSNAIGGPIEFEAGTVIEDHEVKLVSPLTETERISASLYNSDGQGIARDVAEIRVDDPVELTSGIDPMFVEPDPDSGFNYPYYLYAPSRIEDRRLMLGAGRDTQNLAGCLSPVIT